MIVSRAEKSLGYQDYRILTDNCQHYVFRIRNNVSKSPDVSFKITVPKFFVIFV